MMLEAARNDKRRETSDEILVSIGKGRRQCVYRPAGLSIPKYRPDRPYPERTCQSGIVPEACIEERLIRTTVTLPYAERADAVFGFATPRFGTDQLGKYLYIVNDSECGTIPSYRGGASGRRYASSSDRRYRPQRSLCHFCPA